MSLLEQLNEGPQPREKKCRAALQIDALPEDVGSRITDILSKIVQGTGEYSASWLATTLRKQGIPAHHSTLLRHGRKECSCYVS